MTTPPSPPPPPGTIDEYLQALLASRRFGPQVVHRQTMAAQEPTYGELATPFPPALAAALRFQKLDRLYSHQAEAITRIRGGEHILAATPTASGKSLIYNLPVFERIILQPQSRALYLFPLKALAQDQLRAIETLAQLLPVGQRPRAAIYDGDTPDYQRKKIRASPPQILITNPDMLHVGLLAYHGSWSGFWSELTHVIIDEVHTYRGVFGSHMAWVLRRLQRICRSYGSCPQFVMSSATVGNPAELGANLTGAEVATITASGAPRGRQEFIFFDPLEGTAQAASQLLEAALKRGLRTIVYTQSRKITELIAMWTKPRLGPLAEKLSAYRAGFLPEERREIEAKLTSGELLGVVTTSALELGIDIGELELCILAGYPGSIMATWQRGGRVGRRQKNSLAILVAQEDALDQHFMRHPGDFFHRPVESAVLNPANQVIMQKHLLCAAAERPLTSGDPLLASPAAQTALAELGTGGELLLSGDGQLWVTSRKYPQRQVALRGSGQPFVIRRLGSEEEVGEIDSGRACSECHPGAVYLHRGQSWLVDSLDFEGRTVRASEKEVPFFTRALSRKETEILKVYERVELGALTASLGYLRVTETVTGYQRRAVRGQKLLVTEKLNLPPSVMETEGLWLEIPEALQARLERDRIHFMGGIHAVEHAAIGIFPLLVLCDRNDVGGLSTPFHPEVQAATIFIHDGYPGGVGLSREAFAHLGELLTAAYRAIVACPCETGCPSCVHSPKCGSGNRPIDKMAARLLLEGLLAELPAGGEPRPAAVSIPLAAEARTARADKIPLRYGVFDLETKRSAAEVGGWHRAEEMGMSVAVLYDGEQDRYFTFLEEESGQLIAHLQSLELVVGFNNKRFDNLVLSAYSPANLRALPTLDILEEVKNRLGYRLSLDRLAEHSLGVKKSADGLQALAWYKEGRIAEIAEYCRQDVEITKDLLLFGLKNGYLLFANKAGQLVRCPVCFGRGR